MSMLWATAYPRGINKSDAKVELTIAADIFSQGSGPAL